MRLTAAVLLFTLAAAALISSRSASAGSEKIVPVTQRTLVPSLRFRHLGVAAGLPNDETTSIVQDRKGYVWVGTYDGLASYDGYEFTVLRDKLPDLTITAIVVDPASGDLWVATAHGLVRVDPETRDVKRFSLVPQGTAAPEGGEPAVLSIAVSDDGIVWAGTNGYGLVRLDPKTGERDLFRHGDQKSRRISFDTVTTLLAEGDKLWLGTGGVGIDVLSISQRAVIRHIDLSSDLGGPDSDLIQTFHRDAGGTLWIGTGNGLVRLNEASGKGTFFQLNPDPVSPSNDVNALLDGDGGTLWVATNRQLFLFEPKRGTSIGYAPDRGDPSSLPTEQVTTLMRDHEGMIWVGSPAAGIALSHPLSQHFTFYNLDVRSFFEDPTGHLWLGTQSELCRTENPHTLTGQASCYNIGSLVRSLYEDESGILWGATLDNGLFRLDPRIAALRFFEPSADGASDTGPSATTITHVYGVHDGLWLATLGGGLDYFDKKTERFRVYTHDANNNASISSDSVYSVVPTHAGGALWLTTAMGLDRFDPKTGRVTAVYRQATDGSSKADDVNSVLSVYEAPDGILWLGTYGAGLRRIDPAHNEAQVFFDSEERGRNTVLNLLPDDDGMLWLSTEGGVSRFDPKAHTFDRYYPADGLQGLSFSARSAYKDSVGQIYFGGVTGTNVFRPNQIHRPAQKAPIVLRHLQIDGKDVDLGHENGRLSLPYNHKFLSIDFSVLSYIDPEASQYMYRIDGLHDWVDLGKRHFVTLNTLPSGNYTIHIKGKSRTGTWNEEGLRFSIHVAPPPWRTWWAYVIYCLLLVMIVAVFVLRQRAQLDALRGAHRLSELERELALTSAIQVGCLPAERSVRDGAFALEGFYRPAAECGGDWWSYEIRPDRYLIVVADATGHGAGSAMVTAATVACFRSLADIVDDDARMEAMNREVRVVSRQEYHMTLTAVDLNIRTGEYTVMSAGGVPVFSLPPSGRPKVLMCPGTPLGSPDFELGRATGRIEPGERMLLLTDGLPEVALANTHLLGPRGVANFFMQTRGMSLEDALAHLISKVEEVQVGAQDDDWTAVMVQWRVPLTDDTAANLLG